MKNNIIYHGSNVEVPNPKILAYSSDCILHRRGITDIAF